MMVQVDLKGAKGLKLNAANEMRKIVIEHFTKMGYDGLWKIEAVRETGDYVEERIRFKRIIDVGGVDKLLYQIMPYGKDDSWRVCIIPPRTISVKEIAKKECPPEPEVQPTPEPEQPKKQDRYSDINIGQIRDAKVVKNLGYGLAVDVVCKDNIYSGIIDLCDISRDNNKDELEKYSVGDSLTVSIASIDKERDLIRCSIHKDGIVATSSKDGRFSWVPNQDGTLELSGGYSTDYNNEYELLKWFSEIAKDTYPDAIAREVVFDWLIEHLKEKSGATNVKKQSIQIVLQHLCNKKRGSKRDLFKPYFGSKPTPDGKDGYYITEDGWIELGGLQRVRDEAHKPQVEPAPLVMEESIPEPTQEEIIPPPIEEVKENKFRELSEEEVSLVVDHLRKMVRLRDITKQMEAMTKEKEQLEKEIAENSYLNGYIGNLHSLNVDNILNLLK